MVYVINNRVSNHYFYLSRN